MRKSLWAGLALTGASLLGLLYTYWVPTTEAYPVIYIQGDCADETPLSLAVSFPKLPQFWQSVIPVHFSLFNIRACKRLLIGAHNPLRVSIVDGTNPNNTSVAQSKLQNDYTYHIDPSQLSGKNWISVSDFITATRMSPETYTAFFAIEPAGAPLNVESRSTGAYEIRGGGQTKQAFDINVSRISATFIHLEAISNVFAIVASVILGVGIALVVEALNDRKK